MIVIVTVLNVTARVILRLNNGMGRVIIHPLLFLSHYVRFPTQPPFYFLNLYLIFVVSFMVSFFFKSGQKVGFWSKNGRKLLKTIRIEYEKMICGQKKWAFGHFLKKSGQAANPVFMRVPGLFGQKPTFFINLKKKKKK